VRGVLNRLVAQLLPRPAPVARVDVIAATVAVPLLSVLAVLRASSTLATTTVWAEDGRIFLADAVNRGAMGSLLRTYNGYLHLPARLIAMLAAGRLPDAALVLSGVPCVIVAGIAGFVYFAARPHVASRPLRAVLALSVVLLPVAAGETLANAANLHWFLMFGAFWAALWLPRLWAARLVSALVVFFAVTSDPFPLLLGPLIFLRFATGLPMRERVYLPAAYLSGAILQVFGALTSRQQMPPPSFAGALKLYPLRVVLTTATGFRAPTFLFDHLGWAIVIVGAIAAVALLAVVFNLGDPRQFDQPMLAIGFSVAMFVLYAGLRWSDGLQPVRGEALFHTDSRYSVVPDLLLLNAAVVLMARVRVPVVKHALTGALGVAVAATWIVDFRVPTTRRDKPTWAESLRAAVASCEAGATRVVVEVQPLSRPVPWAVDLPCRAIT
jgi:hypothetical protein